MASHPTADGLPNRPAALAAGSSPGAALLEEKVLFERHGIRAGVLRCSPRHDRFRDLGPAENYVVAFPTSAIGLTRPDGTRFVGAPGTAVMINRGERVLRDEVDPTGDRCCWIGLDESVAVEAVEGLEATGRGSRVFGAFGVDVAVTTYLAIRNLFRQPPAEGEEDAAAEQCLVLATGVIGGAGEVGVGSAARSRRKCERQRELVGAVRADVLRNPGQPLEVGLVARRHGVSPYDLARAFRQVTGSTVSDFSRRSRLLLSLPHLEADRVDLTRVALTFGFASHSHYTMWFRRILGMRPSEYRGRRRHASRWITRGRPAERQARDSMRGPSLAG